MTLVKKIMLAGCVAAVLVAGAMVSQAAEGSVDVAVNSMYVWRGQVLNDEAVIQPSITVSTDYGLSFNTWGNFNTSDSLGDEADKEFNEMDLEVSYTLPVEAVNMEIGVAEFTFPHSGEMTEEGGFAFSEGTREVFFSIGVDKVISPSVTVSYDFDEAEGFYVVAGLDHSIGLIEDKLDLDFGLFAGFASCEYNEYYFGIDDDALNDGGLSLTLSYAVSEALSLSANVQYVKLLDSDIEDASQVLYLNGNDGETFGGVTASYTF